MIIKKIINRITWILKKRKFKFVGIKSYVGMGMIVKNPQYIEIGNCFSAGKNLILQAWADYRGEKTGCHPQIVIGNKVSIMDNCHISCAKKISIGNGVLLGDNVFITDNFHGYNEVDLSLPPIERKLMIKGAVNIGDNVWIGRNVCIMPNVTIGSGAVIGANSVVTHNVPQYTVAVGCPAKIIKCL